MIDPTVPVRPGDVLDGKFEVERVLGHGGMGVVVAARHLVLRERVALKFLLPAAAQRPDVAARFQREAQAAARLRNEHVVRVSDVGRMPDGAPYMVMEYLEGQDLGQVLEKEGPLTVERAVNAVLQACVALAEAHRAGIIHRDLKPSNLFVTTRSDGETVVKVLDFGISKLVQEEGQEKLTSGHLGTPAYMPPEQLRAASDVDARSDVWALGAILFELLTGRYPFDAASLAELFAAILASPAVPLRSIRPDAPPALEAALLRAMEKDRARRWQDVGAFAAAIAPHGGASAPALLHRIARTLGQPSGPVSTTGGAALGPEGPIAASDLPRGAATSYTLAGAPARRSTAWVILGIAAGVAAGGVAGFLALGGPGGAPAASTDASVTVPPAAPPGAVAAAPVDTAPSPTVAPAETAEPVAPPAASSAAAAGPPPSATASAAPPRATPPPPRPAPRASSQPVAAPAPTPAPVDYGGRK